MDYLKILYSSLVSIVALFFLAKLIGNRQISQLTLFDYINGITIGSIAAEMATDLEIHWTKCLLAMVIYGVVTALISYICCKSLKMRRFFNGKAVTVYEKGKFNISGMKRSRLDVNEFLMQARVNGHFDLAEIETAVMEQNGKLSFLPKADSRPVTPKDMALTVGDSIYPVVGILDGEVLKDNLKAVNYTEKQLTEEIKKALIGDINNVALATVDTTGKVLFYKKHFSDSQNDLFM